VDISNQAGTAHLKQHGYIQGNPSQLILRTSLPYRPLRFKRNPPELRGRVAGTQLALFKSD